MSSAISLLPGPQLAALNDGYRRAVARRRLRILIGAALFVFVLLVACVGAEVNLKTFFTYFGNFLSYFDRISKLDDGTRVWTNIPEWF
ncbi:MAG: phosphonate ABC transporter, permease protein PhnE, partial [Bradyrhizobium sp.]|nr:phosphonate ABC transporter, permease protein PhnE [Bradyrhizobium sp.]